MLLAPWYDGAVGAGALDMLCDPYTHHHRAQADKAGYHPEKASSSR
jgi:hypothetical protein